MENFDIYKDIAERTEGDIYIGDTVIIGLNQKRQQISGFDDLALFLYKMQAAMRWPLASIRSAIIVLHV